MSKPSWDEAPEWAQWLTMEEDGTWCWNEDEPQEVDHGWYCEGRYEYAGTTVPDWKQSKTKRPE